MVWVRTIIGVALYLFIFLAFVRRRHRRVLHPYVWIGEARSFKPSWNFLKQFSVLSGVLVLFYLSIPLINEFAEVVMGVPSIIPGSANPSAVLASISPWVLLAVSTILPIIEEWLFRFVIIDSTKKRLGIIGSVFLSASLFGAIHLTNEGYTLGGFVVPFASGLMLGAIFLKWGLKSSIFVHFGNNFFRTVFWMVGL